MMKVTREMQNLLSAIKFVRDKRLHELIALLIKLYLIYFYIVLILH